MPGDPAPRTGEQSDDRPLVLVGLMGAGKSTVGRRLAQRLGRRFIDVDDEIETAADMSIAEIFERCGEAHFRKSERQVVARLMARRGIVIATGGGAFLDEAVRRLIRGKGRSIWLRAGLETLVRRCARRKDRPLLADGEPREVLARLMSERYPVYAEADLVIESDGESKEQTVRRIMALLTEQAA